MTTNASNVKPLHIFIGYDERESNFYDICKFSLERHSSVPVNIYPLSHKDLRLKGFFDRPWEIEGPTGQYIDIREKKPFSTQFAFTRFLVPSLAKSMGITSGWVMFVDCDFIFRKDIKELFDEVEKQYTKALCVVKHDYKPTNNLKMDGCSQKKYNKKLWSSLMLFNLDHPENTELTPDKVNNELGLWLHNFKWLHDDTLIGEISEKWNFIPNHSEERVNPKDIGSIHFTEGGPFFKGYEDCSYKDIYFEEEKLFTLAKCIKLYGYPRVIDILEKERYSFD